MKDMKKKKLYTTQKRNKKQRQKKRIETGKEERMREVKEEEWTKQDITGQKELEHKRKRKIMKRQPGKGHTGKRKDKYKNI